MHVGAQVPWAGAQRLESETERLHDDRCGAIDCGAVVCHGFFSGVEPGVSAWQRADRFHSFHFQLSPDVTDLACRPAVLG